jgi:spore coat protein A
MKRTLPGVGLALGLALYAIPASAQYCSPYPYQGQTNGPIAPLDLPLASSAQPQFAWTLPIPVDYTPDKATFPGWDYYEIQAAKTNPIAYWNPGGTAPAATEFLGLCAPGTFNAKTNTCTNLFTPVWGYGQVNSGGGPLGGAVTYPSMNIRATKGTPVKVKWMNGLPDQHLFCPQPTNYNWPCAIDRTLMGTKVGTGVTQYGGSQQADNAFVVHLHGGDIPPEADGFAEFWVGNATTAPLYTPTTTTPIDPPMSKFNYTATPTPLIFYRPVGTSVLYNYPMVQDAMMIWFHDHALGKTRINVVAGPAGFFQVNDPAVETFLCSKTAAGAPCVPDGKYEINVALQDRDFNAPQPTAPTIAAINYPNGMNQAQVAPVACQTPITPGGNPTVHPQWVPEYFGTFSIVNGMAWPFLNVEPRMYRFHFLAGSNARCWNLGRSDGLPMTVIGTEQGYLPAPVPVVKLLMCPGERYDVVIDFSGLAANAKVTLTNNAPAPFPKGVTPTGQDVGKVLQFRVNLPLTTPNPTLPATLVPVLPVVPAGSLPCAFNPAVGGQGLHTGAGCTPMRQKNLNENLDAVTLFPLRVQIDGTPFEGAITEMPKSGAIEMWKIVNTTGDAHPIHTHLVRHQIISRQKFDTAGYSAATNFAIPLPLPGMTGQDAPPTCPVGSPAGTPGCFNLGVDITPFLVGGAKPPGAWEAGWKDASISFPGEVLTIAAQWQGHWNTSTLDVVGADAAGNPIYSTSPAFLADTSGPYVWHCHIVDHEDNEMMRPVLLQP